MCFSIEPPSVLSGPWESSAAMTSRRTNWCRIGLQHRVAGDMMKPLSPEKALQRYFAVFWWNSCIVTANHCLWWFYFDSDLIQGMMNVEMMMTPKVTLLKSKLRQFLWTSATLMPFVDYRNLTTNQHTILMELMKNGSRAFSEVRLVNASAPCRTGHCIEPACRSGA